MNTSDLVRYLESLFYRFMLEDGYLSGKRPDVDRYLPGHKSYTATYDGTTFIDEWSTGKNLVLAHGRTVILMNQQVVWMMLYEGTYKEEDTVIVRTALRDQCKAAEWNGGRGVSLLQVGAIQYKNKAEGTFRKFKCLEQVISTGTGDVRGYHNCWGGLTINF